MIEAIMLVALGFLMATLCALLLAPSFWRRAERLTTRRLERTMPMSIADTEADRDQLRAGYAIVIRRLEAALSHEKMRSARQLVKISRLEMEIAELNDRAAQLRGRLDAEHNAASVLRRTIATRVPELRDAAESARQLVHVRDHEIRGIVNRLRQREEALLVAQRTTEMQQAEIARLRQSMEMSGAQNAGRFKLRPTQWTIHDYRAEYDRLNVELSKLRERLSVAYDREAHQVKQLRTELQKLADQIVTAATALPEAEARRAIAAEPRDPRSGGLDMDAAERSIDAILSGDPGVQPKVPAFRAAVPAPQEARRGGALMASAVSATRLARSVGASLAGLAGARADDAAQAPSASTASPANTAKTAEMPRARMSASQLLGGPAVGRRTAQAGMDAADAQAPDPAEAPTPEPEKPASPASAEGAVPAAEERANEPQPASEEDADAATLYDRLRATKPPPQTPTGPDQTGHPPSDAAAEPAGPPASGSDAAADAAERPSATGDDAAPDAEAASTPVEHPAPESEDVSHDAPAANGKGPADPDSAEQPAPSLVDRLKQLPENQSR